MIIKVKGYWRFIYYNNNKKEHMIIENTITEELLEYSIGKIPHSEKMTNFASMPLSVAEK